ncbi:Pimeloyl-ACP methyl ester carboxylesterase [Allochromatium warmingii]|uniref:Pimeloyl-ACP methyl ester carboxylesterase n=1 Tax=Allochromatium warmingii TaxID=61595 RepID=A0A1H3HYR5_ALLWA|nr:alpha/beta fold hydrolase [Allochromatium warmingii]SDY19919.1 Pimeloyl-ACP methyl ester carboxylesterase [Allochromatium warmingii]
MASQINPAHSTASTLPAALAASRHDLQTSAAGRVHYYADTQASGRPLVLIHSINAAPSAMEMKPLFEHFRAKRPVYALDLPGFGHSERAKRRYSPDLFAQVIGEFLSQVVQQPADVIAFSLGCEFAALAACAAPERVTSLVMLSPTGFNTRGLPTGAAAERAHRFLSIPLLSDGLYSLLTTCTSIKYFYNQAFVGATPPELIEYAYATTHQPGAKIAPLYFLSGQLFTPRACASIYERVTQPVLALYDKDPNIDFHELPDFLSRHANWRAERIAPTNGMLHWEQPAATAAAIEQFWAALS